jgi:hypothetical protein
LWWKHHKATPVEQAVATAPDFNAAAQPASGPLSDASATAPAASNPAPAADEGMTNDQIIQMVDAKVSPTLIISQIRSSKTNFALTPAEIIRLSKAGVPENVIEAMRNPKRGAPNTPPSGNAPTPASAAKSTTAPKQELPPPPPQPTVAAQQPQPVVTPQPPPPQPASASAANPAPKAPTPPPAQPGSAPSGNSKMATVTVKDGTPFKITLADDIPESVEEGRPVHFSVSEDVHGGDGIVIAKGATVMGAIAEVPGKKVFGFLGGGKLTYKLTTVDGVDGHKFNVRAVQARGSDGSNRPVELPNVKAKSKDLAASGGTDGYIAYIDGDQTVSVRK